jgi:hypothetical protein
MGVGAIPHLNPPCRTPLNLSSIDGPVNQSVAGRPVGLSRLRRREDNVPFVTDNRPPSLSSLPRHDVTVDRARPMHLTLNLA